MATLTSVTNHFPKPKEGFITTLGSSILAGAATVPLNSTSGLTNGDVFVGLIEPGETNEQCFTGIVDTGGNQITGVKWTTGSNVAHTAGVTIVDYVTSTTVGIISKGILVEHNQDGTHSDITADSATITDLTVTNFTIDGTAGADGWAPLGQSLTSVTALGNGSYTAVVSGVDTTGTTSVGQRMKIVKTVTAPTQCTSLNGSTQYYSRSSASLGTTMTFTDDFTVSAWVKLSSYTAGKVASRFNGTSGWQFGVESTGQLSIFGYSGSGANYTGITSYQSIPLNKWVHIAAQLDMSSSTMTGGTANYFMINGVDVLGVRSQGGTNPSSLIQAGNLEIGSANGGATPFPGKISQVALYSAKVTQATIRASMNQTLTGSETSLISAYSFNNSINDLNTTSANNLTANGSAVATNADTPFANSVTGTSITAGTTNYAIITGQTFSTNTTYTLQLPEGETLPTSGGLGTVYYSTQKTPYGFPTSRAKWRIASNLRSDTNITSNATYGAFAGGGWLLTVPVGEWVCGWQSSVYNGTVTEVNMAVSPTVLTGFTRTQGNDACKYATTLGSPSAATSETYVGITNFESVTTPTNYVFYTLGATTSAGVLGARGTSEIFAELAYL